MSALDQINRRNGGRKRRRGTEANAIDRETVMSASPMPMSPPVSARTCPFMTKLGCLDVKLTRLHSLSFTG